MGKIADISKWQGSVDWSAAAKELDYCILRASCGESVDSRFYANAKGCEENGIPFGVYHYVKAGCAIEAIKEAKFFAKVCAEVQQPRFYIADVEYEAQTAETTEAVCVAFLNTLRGLGCQKIGLYIGTRYKWAGKAIGLCDIVWIPRYGKNDGNVPGEPYLPKYSCDLWQYTSKGRLDGIKGYVDLNREMTTKLDEIVKGEREMARVKIGSARIDERGRAVGGVAGDQAGGEVSTQNWYKHSKGWALLRCIVPGMAEYIARAMEAACANKNIGYDQTQNQTLWNQVKSKGYDPAQATKPTETDCARLVRVCVQYAIVATKAREGYVIPDFYTATLASKLVKSGMFKKLTESKYVDREDYLQRGDILVTKTKGHTVVVLSNGSKAGETPAPAPVFTIGDRVLKNGMEGPDVKELQAYLIQLGYDCGRWGADGDFGDATEQAVCAFQTASGCDVDGEVGPETFAALDKVLGDDRQDGRTVEIVGGNCYVRSAPNTTGKILGVAHAGDKLPYQGQQSADGWLLVEHNGANGWVSGKYGKLMN